MPVNMRGVLKLSLWVLAHAILGAALPGAPDVEKRADGPQFKNGQPIDGKGKGAPILGKCPQCGVVKHST